jgi:protein-disulfide isomerase
MAEEESIFAKKPTTATKKSASVLDQPAPAKTAAPAPSAAAPAAKSGGKAGLIVTIVILAAALIAVGIVLTILLVSQNNKDNKKDNTETSLQKKDNDKKDKDKDVIKPALSKSQYITTTDHVRGKADSEVVVTEYADPQCPGCASVTPLIDEIYEEYGDKVAFVYRHYPLSYHKNAEAAVTAIEAAGEQGYFWEMLSAVFANQSDWEYESDEDDLTDAFVTVFEDAIEDGDVDRFKKDLKNDYSDKISTDKTLGRKDSVAATPTVLVNGKQIEISGTRESFKKAVIAEIEKNL